MKSSLFFGVRDIQRDSFPNKENIDFLNYLYTDEYLYFDYEYIGISFSFDFSKKWKSEFSFSFTDEPKLLDLNLKAQYFPTNNFGINIGFYGFSQTIDEFQLFHRTTDIDYGDNFYNYLSKYIFEYGPFLGITGNIEIGRFNFNLNLNSGLSVQKPFDVNIPQYKINSNERRLIEYNIKNSYSLFFSPEIILSCDLIKLKTTTLGLQLHSSWYYSNKSINYEKVTYVWTKDNYFKNYINGEKHNFSKFDLDLGIYLKW